MKIFYKIFMSFFSVSIFTLLVTYFIFYTAFEEALLNRSYDQLSSINVLKKDHLLEFFQGYQNQFDFFLNKHNGEKSWDIDQLDETLKHSKENLAFEDYAILDSSLAIAHHLPQSQLSQLIVDQPNRFKSLLDSAKNGYYISDLLTPRNSLALLAICPLKSNEQHNYFAIFQLPEEGVEKILYQHTGMGESGESYIAGEDLMIRTKSRFSPKDSSLNFSVNKEAIELIEPAGRQRIILDYRGIEVLSANSKIELGGLKWTILTEIDLEEAMQPINTIRANVFGTSMLVFILVILVTLYLSNRLTEPIINVQNVVKKFAMGEFKAKVRHNSPEPSDEISDMMVSINSLGEKLTKLARVADEIGNGNFDIKFTPLGENDILGLAILQMRNKLKFSKEMEATATRKQQLAFVNGQENERKRVARELHDGISQMVSAARFNVSAIRSDVELRDGAKDILDDTIKEIKRISHNLMPRLLEDFGLKAALKQLCQESKTQGDFQIYFEFDSQLKKLPLSREIALCLFRIAQEGLNNIVKYAEAYTVWLMLKLKEDKVVLLLKDDGIGFLPDDEIKENPHHNGLKNIITRTSLVNGNFHIDAEQDGGTEIKVEIPLQIKADKA
ncbi:histidine kinase [Flammeovirgaceae bacterium SG7u.111]|nr:histidine kinase [Flammeovirgaceae bacterium SG7u.132]WPO35677.1 histidine kinase [Flammeovirgaceae bacterium SG7u.111]